MDAIQCLFSHNSVGQIILNGLRLNMQSLNQILSLARIAALSVPDLYCLWWHPTVVSDPLYFFQ